MQAEIITIGDEILIGQIVDTNSAWLGEKLGEAGVRIFRITSIPDRADEIERNIAEAMKRSQLVITTGGLGPTKDDITKHTIARMFDSPLVRHEATFEHIRTMLKKRGKGYDFNPLNQSQAMVPQCCRVIMNMHGTAPAMWIQREGSVLISMPGVPFEMKELMQGEILGLIKSHFALKDIVHKTILTFGLPESTLAETIASWEDALPEYLKLAYLPNPSGIRLRLSAYEIDGMQVREEIDRELAKLQNIIPQYIVGEGNCSLEQSVAEILLHRGESLATAESCTGGNIAHRFTLNAGSSAYFKGGVVAYSNSIKESVLGVSHESLERYGAVSQVVAEEMAQGVHRITGSTYGISTTGIAGPEGGSDEKPVGTVWMALATPKGVTSTKMVFGNLRTQNIERASSNAVNLLRIHLISKK